MTGNYFDETGIKAEALFNLIEEECRKHGEFKMVPNKHNRKNNISASLWYYEYKNVKIFPQTLHIQYKGSHELPHIDWSKPTKTLMKEIVYG